MSNEPARNVFSEIILASDHAGFERKKFLHDALASQGIAALDAGPTYFDPADDYPLTIRAAIPYLLERPHACAILIGKSGQGEAMVANRFPGVRAAVYAGGGVERVQLAREHNDANVLSLGAGFVDNDEALNAVHSFIHTPASTDARHVRRRALIDA